MPVPMDKPEFHRHDRGLRADDLNKIVNMLVRKISGGNGVNVSYFGDRIVISAAPLPVARNRLQFQTYVITEVLGDGYVKVVPTTPQGINGDYLAEPITVYAGAYGIAAEDGV